MKTFIKCASLVSAIMLILSFSQSIHAQEKATKEECVAKVNEAIKLIQKEGIEASAKKIMDKEGSFIWKDSYVFCFDNDLGKTLAHPMAQLIGYPMKKYKDADGKQPFIEVIEVANKEGKGWVSYNFRARGAMEPKMKHTYYSIVPGEKMIVAAGYFE